MIQCLNNIAEFNKLVEKITSQPGYRQPIAFGIARVDRGQKNPEKILQANFPVVNWNENFGSAAIFIQALKESGVDFDSSGSEFVADITSEFVEKCADAFNPFWTDATGNDHKNVQIINHLNGAEFEEGTLTINVDIVEDIASKNFKIVFLFEDTNPESVEAVYLKLYALSLAKAELRKVNLNGAFGILENVAWVGNTPVELDYLRDMELEWKLSGVYPTIDSVDKFPRFLQHIIPADNTRILESSKVRFGAQLAAGTTVMPGASYINFNAGTIGPVMVEGRISSSAIVGAGSDVGGGASILGVLSGTDGNPISIGENTLLGANSVTGIPLGDACIVDAGVSILEGTKITITEGEITKIKEINPEWTLFRENTESFDKAHCDENIYIIKGSELAGLNGIHYRKDSITGRVVVFRSIREVVLNEDLH